MINIFQIIFENFINLKELNVIKVKISNKNEYSIYIKNGTKIAIAYETPNNLNNIFASNNNQANINKDNKFINYFNNTFKDNLSSNIYLSKKRNLKNKMKIKKSETNFNKINVQKFMNPVDYEKYIEEPIYGLYNKKITDFEKQNLSKKLNSLVIDFNEIIKQYWDTTTKSIKKLQCLLLYIKKGKKGMNKKRLKALTIVNYIEGCFLYLNSSLNYNRYNFQIYEKELNILKNIVEN